MRFRLRSPARHVALFGVLLSCTSSGSQPALESADNSSVVPPLADAGPSRPDPRESRLTDLAFFVTERGPRILARGVDAAEAVEMLHLEFFGIDGDPLAVDQDEDGVLDVSAVDVPVVDRSADGAFIVDVRSAPGFERISREVAVSFVGGMAPQSERHVVALQPLTERRLGDRCDAQGFDTCESGATCMPGLVKVPNRCRTIADARGDRCADAARLTLADGATMTLAATGASLWDPPETCASAERRGTPEAAIWMHVPTAIPSLTLFAESADTKLPVDTVLYVYESCTTREEVMLACNDDAPPPQSRVTLENVAEGDYLVVVDTLDRRGGPVRLRATIP